MTEKEEINTPLRRGWTTGACATAAAKAAYHAILTGDFPDPVEITLPGGKNVAFCLSREKITTRGAMAAVEKDAGDDPDVTHGATVHAWVHQRPDDGGGIRYIAGQGIGTVTKAGLPVAVGDAAINPVPRSMIAAELTKLAETAGRPADLDVEISVPQGERMARRTMNPRLGILGGISILGTTGVVIPYSCAAWIASIHQGIDVARAAGLKHLGAATGRTSEAALQAFYDFDESALIDMGDFAGGMLKYLRRHPVEKLTLAGGFAKISKLARGHMDLHSKRSEVDFAWLAVLSADAPEIAALCHQANTAAEVLAAAQSAGFALADKIAVLARGEAAKICHDATEIEVLIFDSTGKLVGRGDG
ncbi:MAG: cobalt-precorrin-5B (C(1))-methyltransferase [Rhodospirillaceae bacterium]|nr:cobalt-precorrin-5B (C(1))-methyltransferase [Rhodospirillaceae bacterium]MBT5193518.1 cobalt-precorrin-5B (C(1))-methyltransferase [Rhodospirillaceae bacterium]MBT5894616.1 cobalt-precorrin-5B (C(1))-methyltransferase [Rhodospirillaceae bacterium]MBT6430091.1 cobalt-precorrin-5B (C(1))-methyltransferase [Rhodospirillaceae bacterium]